MKNNLLTKKQVLGILKILRVGKRRRRELLESLILQKIDGRQCLVCTDSHTMIVIPVDLAGNGLIPFETIDKWYQQAESKDYLDLNLLQRFVVKKDYPVYNFNQIIKRNESLNGKYGVDARKLNIVQEVFGTKSIIFSKNAANIALSNNINEIHGIVLPVRLNY